MSITIALACVEFLIGYANKSSGFEVGWFEFFLGLSKFQIVVCFLSEYQGCLPLYHMDVYRLENGAEDKLSFTHIQQPAK